ncbi:MAG: UDP-N-acetylmuramoyl-L-alanyl-D-glutamate--2,6-diaminopimelate ligase [bacterium]|nr:UDP-N-acetylmuramoyl-L-alanyl-D-glutamate--2,6-diaminopimelate ligase [bacterium]
MEAVLRSTKKIIPKWIFEFFQPYYHWTLAMVAAIIYGFPSKKLKVIGVTGTNGKTTLVHLLSAVLEAAGEPVASVSSLRFKIFARPGLGGKNDEWKNMLKMTMPGRFAVQKFLRKAANAGCKYVVLEVTSEGIKQFRHKGIKFYMAILTNVTPEHIESHGTFEKYRAAKAKLFKAAKIHILNGEDPSIEYFLRIPAKERIIYSGKDMPKDFNLKLLGRFNAENAVAVYHAARTLGVDREIIKKVLESFENIPGRMEFVQREPFSVVVDYAHTPDALEKVYETLRGVTQNKMICVLGSAGGGRDKWKRPEMGKIAAKYCDSIILTNEDPYDENPKGILQEIEKGFLLHYSKQTMQYKLIIDRREAIGEALKSAKSGDMIIITGKGAESWIMGPNGSKTAWDDRTVVREELKKI